MKAISYFKIGLFALIITAFTISGCAPSRVVVVQPQPRPARVVVLKQRPVRTVVVRPAHRPHHVVVRRR